MVTDTWKIEPPYPPEQSVSTARRIESMPVLVRREGMREYRSLTAGRFYSQIIPPRTICAAMLGAQSVRLVCLSMSVMDDLPRTHH